MIKYLEPEALALRTLDGDGHPRELTGSELFAASTAVSLKRIADALCEGTAAIWVTQTENNSGVIG